MYIWEKRCFTNYREQHLAALVDYSPPPIKISSSAIANAHATNDHPFPSQETYHVEAPGAGSAAQPHIPGPHAKPVSYKGNDHVTRIHWSGGHAAHPHLVGVEHYVAAPEPAISVVKTGHGW